VYLEAVTFQAQSWLFDTKSPNGTPLSEVFQQELQLDPRTQAQFILYREMLRAAGPAVPAPSLTAAYATLRGLSVGGQAVGGAASGGGGGWLGAAFGALTGAVRGVGSEFQRVVDGLAWLVRIAVLLTWYAPYLLGIVQMVLVGLLPFLLPLALIPGMQLQPLLHYFLALLFVLFSPLWWALVELASLRCASQPPQIGHGWDAQVAGFLVNGLWVASITALGLFVVIATTGIIVFANFRAIGAAWRGGMF